MNKNQVSATDEKGRRDLLIGITDQFQQKRGQNSAKYRAKQR